MKYPTTLSSITINGLEIRNRIVMPPIGSNFASVTGEVTEQMKKYYELRAKGGTGLIIVENACVDYPMGTNGTKQLRIDNVQYVPGLYELVERIHTYGAKACIQINHAGASAYGLRLEGRQPVSASNIPSKTGGTIPRPLTEEEIMDIVKSYGRAAANAKLAGFDMVEIHGGHSYLLSQFMSPLFNDRTDKFGGNPENRARFTRLVIDEIRNQVGDRYPLSLRISADDMLKGGNNLEDTIEILGYLVEGVDVINVSIAQNDNLYLQHDAMSLPEGWRAYMARAIKDAFNIPVMTSGNLRTPEIVEGILEKGDADFAVMGRGLIAEPNWVKKVRFGQEDQLRRCISCNIGCADHRLAKSQPIRCTVNPDLIYEDRYKDKQVKGDLKVLIMGGGTAGMEAAATAAEVGCQVDLYERKDKLGGIIADAAKIPAKSMINYFLNYQKDRLNALDKVNIHLNEEMTLEKVKALDPDVIVYAAGARPLLPNIPGLRDLVDKENSPVQSTQGFLDSVENFQDDYTGKKIVVAGGGAVGLDIVEFFAEKGADLTCIEMKDSLGQDLDTNTRLYMNHILEKYEVKGYTKTKLTEVTKEAFTVEREDGSEENLDYDLAFVCLGMQAINEPVAEIKAFAEKQDKHFLNIGDSARPRKIIDGVFEGRQIVAYLDMMDLLK